MMMRIPRVLLLLSAVLIPRPAIACSCEFDMVRFARAGGLVILGEVVGVTYLDAVVAADAEPRIVVEIKVFKSWGAAADTVLSLHTFENRWSCEGYWFQVGRVYLIAPIRNAEIVEGDAGRAWPPGETLGVFCGALEGDAADEQIKLLNASALSVSVRWFIVGLILAGLLGVLVNLARRVR